MRPEFVKEMFQRTQRLADQAMIRAASLWKYGFTEAAIVEGSYANGWRMESIKWAALLENR